MTDLPDVNVWLALADENHLHHPRAKVYWQGESAPSIAFCRATMLGLLRLSTHPKVLSRPLAPGEAWDLIRRYRIEARVGLLDDSWGIDAPFRALSLQLDFPHHLWTDAFLAAFAEFHGCRIVSFDSDFRHFPNLEFLHLIAAEGERDASGLE